MPRKTNSDSLLDAAGRVFGRRGYHAARVSEIAAEAGVAQGTVYLHFASKEQLYIGLLERFAGMLRATSEGLAWADIRSADELGDRLAGLCADIFELCAANREVASLLLDGPPVGGRSLEIRTGLLSTAEAIASRYLAAGTEAGLFRTVNAHPIARAIVGFLFYTVTRTIVEDGRTERLRELAEELVDFEMHGLLGSRAPAGVAGLPTPTGLPE
jgi:AcrR family transcriptional regulator